MPMYMWSFEGWTTGGGNVVTRRFDLDSDTWVASGFATAPTAGIVVSVNGANTKQAGGWDGTYWYSIGTDGKLYRYNPGANTFSSALNGGAAVVGPTVEDRDWCMASDGRYVYILESNAGFKKYDTGVADSVSALSAAPGSGGGYSEKMFLAFDGDDRIYGSAGGTAGVCGYYSISGGTWTAIATPATFATDAADVNCHGVHAFYLQGKLWLGYYLSTYKMFAYDPGTNTWATKATHAGYGNETFLHMAAEKTTDQIQFWLSNFNSAIYTISLDSWSSAGLPPNALLIQGFNQAVARTYTSVYEWYEADGTTPTATTEDQSVIMVGDTPIFHYQLKSITSHPSGVTVSVPTLLATDAEDVVTICETVGGTYATSFNHSASISAGGFIHVYVKVIPTVGQTLGFLKQYGLLVTAN